ncbi:nickase [Pusillimonas sp. T7-7]|uniref:relaxase/mobilization nuclease domain-containing protein n=1 Tax=Pusillimonas sp. (strain T7-7) TaxID=1007105 RepID=UPI00020852FE|nr:relaxase/mobilization nuclease domain-containing protein [Pusillimonas sp. T7-7]AEC20740.1 nickase [Pusillimonas sp. T7-7]
MSQVIDGVLKDWGERIFYPQIKGRIGKRTITRSAVSHSPKQTGMTGSARIREKLSLASRNAPEVMVKISGGGKGMRQIKAHLDYISRNGLVDLENEDGQLITGREAVRDLRDEWKYGQYGIPEEAQHKEAFNIVLSMPPGTDRTSVNDAARAFAATEFSSNHAYVFAAHDDERHPHVHLCVKSLGFDGTRLNPRKADLQRWREGFAEALRQRGIEANATPRTARGAIRGPVKQTALHKQQLETPEIEVKNQPVKSRLQDSFSVTKKALHAYGKIARALSSGDATDRQLALDITRFVAKMPVLQFLKAKSRTLDREDKLADTRSSLSHSDLADKSR